MPNAQTIAHEFFDRYAVALLGRDEKAIAGMYSVPALILFPGQSVLVTDAGQTEDFFAQSWSQYEGVHEVGKQVAVIAEARAACGSTSPGPTTARRRSASATSS